MGTGRETQGKHARLSCRTCRQSKVRCDLEVAGEGGTCSRCARLSIQCVPNGPCMRGRRPRVSEAGGSNAGRASALDHTGAPAGESSSHPLALFGLPANLSRLPSISGVDADCGWPLVRDVIIEHGSPILKLHWVTTAFARARRIKSWGARLNALPLAALRATQFESCDDLLPTHPRQSSSLPVPSQPPFR